MPLSDPLISMLVVTVFCLGVAAFRSPRYKRYLAVRLYASAKAQETAQRIYRETLAEALRDRDEDVLDRMHRDQP